MSSSACVKRDPASKPSTSGCLPSHVVKFFEELRGLHFLDKQLRGNMQTCVGVTIGVLCIQTHTSSVQLKLLYRRASNQNIASICLKTTLDIVLISISSTGNN